MIEAVCEAYFCEYDPDNALEDTRIRALDAAVAAFVENTESHTQYVEGDGPDGFIPAIRYTLTVEDR